MKLSPYIRHTRFGFEVWVSCSPREIFATLSEAERFADNLREVEAMHPPMN